MRTTGSTAARRYSLPVFDVVRIAEQPIWLNIQGLPYGWVLPDGAFPLVWNKVDDLFGYLSFAVGIPFRSGISYH
ncbi:hypothetical protein ACGF5C_28065 [Micromonospora sp. NPDC047620]|uniref:hypothetical protein n=1 Tax=Micromonospora sp. NPDC047620 TaxID=3364251 RepID=UPI0037234A4B